MLSHSAALSTVCVVLFVSDQLHRVFINYEIHSMTPNEVAYRIVQITEQLNIPNGVDIDEEPIRQRMPKCDFKTLVSRKHNAKFDHSTTHITVSYVSAA